MQIMVRRVKMAGMENRAFSYDVYVLRDSLANGDRFNHSHWINGKHYVLFEDATLPTAYHDMPCGFDKLDVGEAHRKRARVTAWKIVREVFPETQILQVNALPLLWAVYPEPLSLSHDSIELSV